MYYQIWSKAGAYYGTWEADSPSEALLQLHREAGYSESVVRLNAHGRLNFATSEDRRLFGDIGDWDIEEVS